jgi:hypothetical protein
LTTFKKFLNTVLCQNKTDGSLAGDKKNVIQEEKDNMQTSVRQIASMKHSLSLSEKAEP